MKRGEQVLGAVLLLFSLFILRESSLIESGAEFGMGPGFMPLWLSVGLALCSVGLIYRARTLPDSSFEPSVWPDSRGIIRVAAVLAAYLIAVVVMKPLGMPVSIAIIMSAMVMLLGSRDWKMVTLAAFVTAIGVYLVFGRWLHVPLEMGVLEELLPLY